MLSAPATIPATSEATFNPAFAPLSVGTPRCCRARSWSPADRANARTGTRPADDTRFGSSNTAEVAVDVWQSWSGSPSALLRPGPLRTGRATFTASGSSKPPRASVLCSLDRLPLSLFTLSAVGVHEARGLIVAVDFSQNDAGLA